MARVHIEDLVTLVSASEAGPHRKRALEVILTETHRLCQIETLAIRLSDDVLGIEGGGSYSLNDAERILTLAGFEREQKSEAESVALEEI